MDRVLEWVTRPRDGRCRNRPVQLASSDSLSLPKGGPLPFLSRSRWDLRVPVGSFILALRPSARKSLPYASGKKNGSLPVTRLDPVSPTTSSDVVSSS